MNIDAKKIELIDWIARLQDQKTINSISQLKAQLARKQVDDRIEVFGSGKDMIDFVSDDFNDPIEHFKDYEK